MGVPSGVFSRYFMSQIWWEMSLMLPVPIISAGVPPPWSESLTRYGVVTVSVQSVNYLILLGIFVALDRSGDDTESGAASTGCARNGRHAAGHKARPAGSSERRDRHQLRYAHSAGCRAKQPTGRQECPGPDAAPHSR